ncbi:NYN domain-containing protein [bacterium]|nr:NYN domain-containing protein [bacterium]
MSQSPTNIIALFCDFENIALGVKDAKYKGFEIQKIIERFLLRGNIVVKKAYCDWARYKEYKASMHEASFELIEIPHVRQSGKNSADIRLVVDALDLCYTKQHVDTFVIISGDSDFSPLVSKLRENNKKVIGVGVKNSTSDLLISNCDDFVFYDDLVRKKAVKKVSPQAKTTAAKRIKKPTKTPDSSSTSEQSKKLEAWNLIAETFDALLQDRGEEGKIWGSMVKQALKRRKPGFSESYYGYRSFGDLLEDAGKNGFVGFTRDEKSGSYIVTQGKTEK